MTKLRDQVLDLMEIRPLEMTGRQRALRNSVVFALFMAVLIGSDALRDLNPYAGYAVVGVAVAIAPLLIGFWWGSGVLDPGEQAKLKQKYSGVNVALTAVILALAFCLIDAAFGKIATTGEFFVNAVRRAPVAVAIFASVTYVPFFLGRLISRRRLGHAARGG